MASDTAFLARAKDALNNQKTELDFLRLATLYLHGSAELRETIRAAWTPKHRWKVPRPADMHLKRGLPPEQNLIGALVYASIENRRGDERAVLAGLCAAAHAAQKAGLDPRSLFERAAQASTSEFAAFLRAWFDRSEEDRSLKAFGLADRSTKERIKFVEIRE
jgi:hypothetical protein